MKFSKTEVELVTDAKSPVYVFSCHFGGKNYGMIVTWVTLASLDKNNLRFVAVLSPSNATTKVILSSKRFCINKLSIGQEELVGRFGLSSSQSLNKFEGLDIGRTEDEHPFLTQASAWGYCELISTMKTPDRIIIYAKVLSQKLTQTPSLFLSDAMPLLPQTVQKMLSEKYQSDIRRDANLLAKASQ